MKPQHNLEQITLYLTQTLSGYEVIPANWGWHIHKGDKYCGHMEYQRTKGWQGRAFNRLPTKLKEQLKKFAQSGFSMRSVTT
ncbi:hypothetical protein [Fischerella sp. PCC 9605]|uniref:hypothetical protein n=1 Tax=Fischerella sp. PCC 9605 TaxID=1173024 RepID=UPI00047C61AB|nr:hypothetical protein [Fischerella sp. PCC 9605]